ncbi:hypothetical protein NDI37_16475 [Funiculus sociatus GB2-A5]|uniref:Uncharacterized protein n=2 Tax=Cyanobacteriota TaxID=1117 RepID=A0ABV0JRQ9_9CYAN
MASAIVPCLFGEAIASLLARSPRKLLRKFVLERWAAIALLARLEIALPNHLRE